MEDGEARGRDHHNGEDVSLPLGQKVRSSRWAKQGGQGSSVPPGRGPGSHAPPPPPNTHQHDGKSFLQFTWLGHWQLQRHVVRPEIRLLRIHAPCVAHVDCALEPGVAPGPWRPRRKSLRLPATGSRPLVDLPGSPPSAAPRRVCSARRSLAAAPRAELSPGLPHALRRPSAAPASIPREGSSGRGAPICMLLGWHTAPCQ